jgi:hypothetical protein
MKKFYYILGSLQAFTGIGAIPAGYGLILGVLLSLWIIVQVAWISLLSVLQPLFLLIGLINTYLGWRIIKTGQSKSYSNSGSEKV